MVAFYIASICLIIFSYINLVKYEAWWIRIFDFVHIQLAVGILVTVVLGSFLLPKEPPVIVLLCLLVTTLVYHIRLILPFTRVYKKQVLVKNNATKDNALTIMVSNVYQFNTNYNEVLRLIKSVDADLVLVVETNYAWEKALGELKVLYKQSISYPLENTYGMILFSKLKILKSSINFLIENDIPSFELTIELPSGQSVDIYTAHPRPPSPTEQDKSIERDAELLQIAKKVKSKDRPAIVMGDLNDVAWSHTTQLVKRISGLLDPRIGRGLYNTFHAKNPFMRFPLDHIFSSHHFTLGKMERLPFCNSDHFPIFIELYFEPKRKSKENQEQADKQDYKEANAKIAKAKTS
jgi:endonuclease/exonuclease/phosphatase (EEP) superfamily protein YafD